MKHSELFYSSYSYCNLQYGDPSLLSCVVEKISELANSKDWSEIEKYLANEDDPLFLNNRCVLLSHCRSQKGFDASIIENISDPDNLLHKWADSLSKLLLRIVQQTKDYDYVVQQILNYEDFIIEMGFTEDRRKIACEIYDLRGIDFFLMHYMQGITKAHNDDALWNNADLIINFLNELGRQEEAAYVAKEIKDRKERFKEIVAEYSTINCDSISETFDNIRLAGERFWVDYISSGVWQKLSNQSRRELVDAFASEIMLKKGILREWSQVALSLCKVIEREIADILFTKWIEQIQKAVFVIPKDASEKLLKKIKSREKTFRILKTCATPPIQPPTLGQLYFISKFWSDDVMNQCTNLFSTINEKSKSFCKDYALKVQKLAQLLEDKNFYCEESPSFVELRNASAHPGHEDDFTWDKHIPWLKESLGKPPKELLRLVVELKG